MAILLIERPNALRRRLDCSQAAPLPGQSRAKWRTLYIEKYRKSAVQWVRLISKSPRSVTRRWAGVMPAKLAETLGLMDTIRAIPIVGSEPYPTIGLVVRHREPMTPLTAALVTEARRIAPTLDPQQRTQIMLDHGLYDEGYLVVIAPTLNFHVQDAAEAYQAQLQEPADGKVRFDAEGKRAFDPPQS
jgi:hypothetical protein